MSNVVRFPHELRSLDLDALIALEPDIMQADQLSERFGLAILPLDLIDVAETEARERIAKLNAADAVAFRAMLRRMSEQAFARAIASCLRAQMVDARARRLRRQADEAKAAEFGFMNVCAVDAERSAAIATLDALTEAHRARGIDAAVTLKLQGCDRFFPFGLVTFVANTTKNRFADLDGNQKTIFNGGSIRDCHEQEWGNVGIGRGQPADTADLIGEMANVVSAYCQGDASELAVK